MVSDGDKHVESVLRTLKAAGMQVGELLSKARRPPAMQLTQSVWDAEVALSFCVRENLLVACTCVLKKIHVLSLQPGKVDIKRGVILRNVVAP